MGVDAGFGGSADVVDVGARLCVGEGAALGGAVDLRTGWTGAFD